MKKILSLVLTLTLAVTFFIAGQAQVSAEVPANDCTTSRTVVVHYKRWDDDYTNMDFWTWGTGTNGSGNPQIVGEDDFGAVAYFCIDDDAEAQAGLIPRLTDWSYKDGVDANEDADVDNKFIPLRADLEDNSSDFVGFDENGVKHVYVLQGSAEVYTVDPTMPYFQKDGFGTLVVVYYDPAESYEGWNVWNWGAGTDGTAAGDAFGGSGVPFQYELGIDQGTETGKYRVAVFNIAADADDNMGFIVRTDAWEKQWDADLNIDVTNIKGSGTEFVFYLGGSDQFFSSYEDFDAQINFFEIDTVTALDPNSVEVVFNKEVVTSVDDVITFNDGAFLLKDVNGDTVEITQVSFNSTSDLNDRFTLITETALSGDLSPYKLYYMPGGAEMYTKTFDVDNEAPTIVVVGPTETTLELGDTYSLPNYYAQDMVDGEAVDIYDYRIKDGFGTVDTRNAGIYEIVIEATDHFGNVAEKTITVTVTDPCDETAHLEASNVDTGLIALLVGIPLAFSAAIALKRSM